MFIPGEDYNVGGLPASDSGIENVRAAVYVRDEENPGEDRGMWHVFARAEYHYGNPFLARVRVEVDEVGGVGYSFHSQGKLVHEEILQKRHGKVVSSWLTELKRLHESGKITNGRKAACVKTCFDR